MLKPIKTDFGKLIFSWLHGLSDIMQTYKKFLVLQWCKTYPKPNEITKRLFVFVLMKFNKFSSSKMFWKTKNDYAEDVFNTSTPRRMFSWTVELICHTIFVKLLHWRCSTGSKYTSAVSKINNTRENQSARSTQLYCIANKLHRKTLVKRCVDCNQSFSKNISLQKDWSQHFPAFKSLNHILTKETMKD